MRQRVALKLWAFSAKDRFCHPSRELGRMFKREFILQYDYMRLLCAFDFPKTQHRGWSAKQSGRPSYAREEITGSNCPGRAHIAAPLLRAKPQVENKRLFSDTRRFVK
jgi:hypothetical protein